MMSTKKSVTRVIGTDSNKSAERTGLEPATPGVTVE
jgi:hypothetical protein